jgi:hypothetical protein
MVELAEDNGDVHALRKRVKDLRSLLRLLNASEDKRWFRRLNARLRDLSKPLAPLRDAEAVLEALDRLESISIATRAPARQALLNERTTLRRDAAALAQASAEALELARRPLHHAARKASWDRVERGLRTVQRATRKSMRLARDRASAGLCKTNHGVLADFLNPRRIRIVHVDRFSSRSRVCDTPIAESDRAPIVAIRHAILRAREKASDIIGGSVSTGTPRTD